jgi:two-component system cell cycle response regulator DivK
MNYTWSQYTTLVAEDDPLNFRYIELLLTRRTGIKIIWAKDGIQAVEMSKKNDKIDIILLDLQLPELDGLSTLKAIREFNQLVPIIIQTANSWNNVESICHEAGCDGFFNKPLNIDELLAHMDYCLESYTLIRQAQFSS